MNWQMNLNAQINNNKKFKEKSYEEKYKELLNQSKENDLSVEINNNHKEELSSLNPLWK